MVRSTRDYLTTKHDSPLKSHRVSTRPEDSRLNDRRHFYHGLFRLLFLKWFSPYPVLLSLYHGLLTLVPTRRTLNLTTTRSPRSALRLSGRGPWWTLGPTVISFRPLLVPTRRHLRGRAPRPPSFTVEVGFSRSGRSLRSRPTAPTGVPSFPSGMDGTRRMQTSGRTE